MDEWGARSQRRAVENQENGFFEREIRPSLRPTAPSSPRTTAPARGTTVEKLATLQPVFRPNGSVTAGNACPLNDGAAAVIGDERHPCERARHQAAGAHRRVGVSAFNPEIMGLGPIEASRQALKRANLTIDDIDLVEINEAFRGAGVAVRRSTSTSRTRS